MLYFQVTTPDKVFRFNGYLQTVGRELFTAREFERYSAPDKYGCRLRREWVRPVNVSPRRVFFFFGARFADEKDIHPANVEGA